MILDNTVRSHYAAGLKNVDIMSVRLLYHAVFPLRTALLIELCLLVRPVTV